VTFKSVADTTLSLATTIGFAVKDWQSLAVGAATLETLIGFFYPQSQNEAITAVFEVRDELLAAVNNEGEVILAGVWQDFAKEHFADINASAMTYGRYITPVLAASGTPKETDLVTSQENASFASDLEKELSDQTGGSSLLTKATGFLELSVDCRNTSIHLHLLAATWYLSWCKMGLLWEWLKIQNQYLPQITAYKAAHPDWQQHLADVTGVPASSADDTGSLYHTAMATWLPHFLSYAAPILSTLDANLKKVDAAVAKRTADFTLEHDASGWYYRDAQTGQTSKHMPNRDTANIAMITDIGSVTTGLQNDMYTEYDLGGVDPEQVTTSLKTLDEFRDAATTYGIPLDSSGTTPPSP